MGSNEYLCIGRTLPEAYCDALQTLHSLGEITDCADWGMKQKELAMTMVVEEPLAEPMISKLFIGGPEELEQYRQEMLDGILDFEIERGNWTYTYHDRMVNYPLKFKDFGWFEKNSIDQIQFVIDELKRNPSSRRAVIIIRDVSVDAGSDDPSCLQLIQYFIRDNKLHCKLLFRSNDACKATFMNAFALIMLQKRIADELGVEMGTYTHRANSFHCYEKDFDLLEGYVNRLKSGVPFEDLCYEYDGDWQELMEDYKDKLVEKVNDLKNNR